jgi:hypothetical protein
MMALVLLGSKSRDMNEKGIDLMPPDWNNNLVD